MFSSFSCMYVFENNSGSKFTKSLHKTWWCRWILNLIKNTSVYEFNTQINFLRKIHAIRSQNIKAKATQRNTRCKNCSSSYWADPGAGPVAPNPWSPQLKLVAKNPNGNAPKRKRTIGILLNIITKNVKTLWITVWKSEKFSLTKKNISSN